MVDNLAFWLQEINIPVLLLK
jgi:hypothetical protein